MSDLRRWRGLRALVSDAIEHGSTAIERVHRQTAARPFDLLELIPPIAPPVRAVRVIHDAAVGTTYGAIRLVNRAVGLTLDVALDVLEHRDTAKPDEPG